MPQFTRSTSIHVFPADSFAWHERPGALERLTPPWERVRVICRTGGIASGSRVELEARMGPLPVRWDVEHQDYIAGERFVDQLRKGPFARWRHEHLFRSDGNGGSVLEDRIDYRLPLEPLSRIIAGRFVDRQLSTLFRYRHDVTRRDLEDRAARAEVKPMKILITGATGVIGSALWPLLSTAGHTVVGLGRSGVSGVPGSCWNPETGEIDSEALADADAIIHLAGENLAARRWSAAQKQKIYDSRVVATQRLCTWLASREHGIKAFISGSAMGIYGHRGDDWVDEQSPAGTGFLAETCRDWEAATKPLEATDVRVVHLRTGLVLTPKGSPLAKLLLPFKLGMGGRIGDGHQYMSWIDVEDYIQAVSYLLEQDDLSGPVNLVAPNPVTNREFTHILGRVLKRPTLAPMPAFAARLAFGEMADEALLASTRVRPRRLDEAGFLFRYPELETSLRHLLGRS